MADKLINVLDDAKKRLKDMGDGTYAEVVAVVGASAGAGASEILVTSYVVTSQFAGGNVGNLITLTQIFDFSVAPPAVTSIWKNEFDLTVLPGAPPNGSLALLGDASLTDAELRASPVPVQLSGASAVSVNNFPAIQPVSVDNFPAVQTVQVNNLPAVQTVQVNNLPATQPVSAASLPLPTGASTAALQTTLNTNVGAPADAVATTDTGSFSVIAFIKRALQNWTSLLARIPAALGQSTMANSLPVTIASNQSAVPVSVSGLVTTVAGDNGQVVGANFLRSTTNSSVSNARYFCAQNVGAGGGNVMGQVLNPGEKIEFTAPQGFRFSLITWAAGSTTMLITYIL